MSVKTKAEHTSVIIMPNVKMLMDLTIVVVWKVFMEMELFAKT